MSKDYFNEIEREKLEREQEKKRLKQEEKQRKEDIKKHYIQPKLKVLLSRQYRELFKLVDTGQISAKRFYDLYADIMSQYPQQAAGATAVTVSSSKTLRGSSYSPSYKGRRPTIGGKTMEVDFKEFMRDRIRRVLLEQQKVNQQSEITGSKNNSVEGS